MEKVSVGYDDRVVLSRLNLTLADDDRVGLLGANGNGKSTFAKLLGGRLAPMSGKLVRANKLDVGFFAQHQIDELDSAGTPYSHIAGRMHGAPEARIRARAALIGFSGVRADTAVALLSGGEKARLLMGLATFAGPQLLILDEPTNHLDLDSRAELIEAINEYEGACILVSHDRRLLEACVDRLWLVARRHGPRLRGRPRRLRPLRARPERASRKRQEGKRAPSARAGAAAARGRHAAPRLRAAAQGNRRGRAENAALSGSVAPHRRRIGASRRSPGKFRQGRRSRQQARQVGARACRGRGGLARIVGAGRGDGVRDERGILVKARCLAPVLGCRRRVDCVEKLGKFAVAKIPISCAERGRRGPSSRQGVCEGHTRQNQSSGRAPGRILVSPVCGLLNCDRRRNSSFSTVSVVSGPSSLTRQRLGSAVRRR